MEEYLSSYALGSSDPFKFFRLMFRTYRVSMLSEGIEIEITDLRNAGRKWER